VVRLLPVAAVEGDRLAHRRRVARSRHRSDLLHLRL